MPATHTLEAEDVRVHFAGVKAVDGVSLRLQPGEIVGLIGPNGAGKTTMINALSGFQRPTAGRALLGGTDVSHWPPERLAHRGLARTFQSVRLFGGLSAEDNVTLGGVGVGLGLRAAREQAHELLARVGLRERAHVNALAMPQGEERLLGLARALAIRPRLLLLDEPAAGLNEEESDELMSALADVRASLGVGLLVVEHDMRLIMRLCDRIQVLDHGRTIAIGKPEEVREDPAVVEAYLGTGSRHAA